MIGDTGQRVRVGSSIQALECRVVAGFSQQFQANAGSPFPFCPVNLEKTILYALNLK